MSRALAFASALLLGLWWIFHQSPDGGPSVGASLASALGVKLPADVGAIIREQAAAWGVDPNLLSAQAYEESRGNQSALSPKGAIGVMQLMPKTADWLNVDPYDVSQNIEGGAHYMADLLDLFNGDVGKALAAYNWGQGHVLRAGDAWFSSAPSETQGYVASVLGDMGQGLPADLVG